MVSKRKKGADKVKEAIAIFNEAGFRTWKPSMKAIFIGPGKVVSQSQDIYECFDFEATSEKAIIYVQVTHGDSHASERRTKIDDLKMPLGTVRLVMMRVPNKTHNFTTWVKSYSEWSKPFLITMDDASLLLERINSRKGEESGTTKLDTIG